MPDLWPYVPLPDIEETLTWETDVWQAMDAEMRHALHGGRQVFDYSYSLSSGYQEAARLLRGNPYGTWDVPIWSQSSKAGTVLSADTSLNVDLNAEYTERAVIFGGCDDYVIAEIDSITGTLNLTAAVGQDFTNPTVAPLRECQLPQGASINRTTRRNTAYQLSFVSVEEFAGSGSDYQLLDGIPYMRCSANVVGPLSGIIRQPVYEIDNQIGVSVLIPERTILDHVYSVTIVHSDRAEDRSFRDFLGDVRGRDGVFWIADWEGGVGTPSAAATSIDFAAMVSDETYYVGRFISFGTEVREVLTAADLGGGLHRVTFDALVATPGNGRFLRKVRMNTDRILINHQRGLSSRSNFTVIEVDE